MSLFVVVVLVSWFVCVCCAVLWWIVRVLCVGVVAGLASIVLVVVVASSLWVCGVSVSCCAVVAACVVEYICSCVCVVVCTGCSCGHSSVVVRRLSGSSFRRDSVVMSVSLSVLLCRVSCRRCGGVVKWSVGVCSSWSLEGRVVVVEFCVLRPSAVGSVVFVVGGLASVVVILVVGGAC